MSAIELVCKGCGEIIEPLLLMTYYEKRLQTMILGLGVFVLVLFVTMMWTNSLQTITLLKAIK